MVRSIFANQDKAVYLDSLIRAGAVFDKEPNKIFLRIWVSKSLPHIWLRSLSFDLINCDGKVIRCSACSFGLDGTIARYCLEPQDKTVDLRAIFAVPGHDFSLTLQYVEAVTYNGLRKRLYNGTYREPPRTQKPGQ